MPVVSVACAYRRAAKYGDRVSIYAFPRYFNGIRLRYAYEVRGEDGELIADGQSEHCFIDALTRKPMNLKRRMPGYAEALSRLIAELNGGAE